MTHSLWRLLGLLTLSFLFSDITRSEEAAWYEDSLQKAMASLDQEFNRNQWETVIEKGKELLPHCVSLYREDHPSCIILLRHINMAYERLRLFNPNPDHIRNAYEYAKRIFGQFHFSTQISRDYYYRYSLYREDYGIAITLLRETMQTKKKKDYSPFEELDHTTQLYALQGLLKDWPSEEITLKHLLDMTDQLIGKESEEYITVANALADNYCIQKKYFEYFELVKALSLETNCRLKQ